MVLQHDFISTHSCTCIENYPHQPPKIVLPAHLEHVGLKGHLTSTASKLLDSPMLFDLLDATKEWVTSHPLSLPPVPSTATESTDGASRLTPPPPSSQTVCKFYKQGKCKFGDKCRNYHPNTSPKKPEGNPGNAQPSVPSTNSKTTKESVSRLESKEATNQSKYSSEEAESEKKVKMRTASDIISRILWDPDLPTEKFTVGYLDRFVGIIEKPFTAFSWEDIASVGINVLAVPKHRIQYFKFDGEIVWDKQNQLDDFFGSRGGRVIQDIVQAKQSEVKEESQKAEGSTSEKSASVSKTVKLVEEDDIEENSTASARVYSNKDRPTHFVSIHITDPEVVKNADAIQSHIVSHTPELKEGCLQISALHVTLCMVRLDSEQQAATAKMVLESMVPHFIHILPRCVEIEFTGVDNFRERLVYAKVAKNSALERIVSCLIECFQLAGLRTLGNHDEYTPHMTLVKLSRPMQRDLRTASISASTYLPFKDKLIGKQQVDALHLCSMTDPKQADGFYKRVCRVSNSLSYHASMLSSLITSRLQQMKAYKMITQDQEFQLLKSLNVEEEKSASERKFDFVIDEILKTSLQESAIVHAQEGESNAQPTVVILRGAPGSGKSFFSQHCAENLTTPKKVQICSADDFFSKTGSYKFDPSLLPSAHSYCFNLFMTALANKKELIIVDNTNLMQWEYQIYTYICEILGLQYHILEIPCPSEAIGDAYQSRNAHRIDRPVFLKIVGRWEEDNRVSLIPPRLAYPTVRPIEPPQFSLQSLHSPDEHTKQLLSAMATMTAVYTAVFLTEESQWKLVSTFGPTHPKVWAHHITLCFEPSVETIASSGIGKKVTVKVIGYATNEKAQAVVVNLPRGITCQNRYPHITISTEENLSPKVSNIMLETQSFTNVHDPKSITLEGIIGVVVREGSFDDKVDFTKIPSIPIVSQSDLQKYLLPKLGQEALYSSVDTDICTGPQDITQLFIFDFDLTLFNSPDPKEGRELYEKCTGQKWSHKGWLSWPKSLLPPLKVYPGPALPDYHIHYGQAGSMTIVLTARIQRTEKAVKTILENYHLYPDRLYLRPDSSQQSSANFKAVVVRNLLEEFPNVSLVKFWDDKHDNLAAVQRIGRKTTRDIQIEVIDANSMLPVKASKQGKKINLQSSIAPQTQHGSILEACLSQHGYLPNEVYKKAALSGISFLANQFCKVTGFKGEPNIISYPFGSFKLNRVGDIDLCFLHPQELSAVQCLDQLAEQLKSCGINYIHKGYSSRCPRLKVMLEFTSCPSIDYDIIFAAVSEEFDTQATSLSEQLPPTSIAKYTKPGDQITKSSLLGPCFLKSVQDIISKSSISVSQFGAVVEMVVRILAAQRQKGNAYHCIRTFHIVQLLAEYIKSSASDSSETISDCDTLFKCFVSYVTKLSTEKWQKVFGIFVPDEFIPRISEVFASINREITSYDFPSQTCYEELLLTRPSFPPKGYTTVELSLSSSDKALHWSLNTIIEARLPSYIRQLLELGLDVVPNGNNSPHRFCFAVPVAKSSKQTLQQVLRPFWNEISEYRSQSNVDIRLNFGSDLPQGKNPSKDGQPSSSETELTEQLSKFAASKDKVLHLPCSLSPFERMIVHETAERLGLQHRSEGTGKARHIAVYKK